MKVGSPTGFMLITEDAHHVEVHPEVFATYRLARRAQALLDENDPADIYALCPMVEEDR